MVVDSELDFGNSWKEASTCPDVRTTPDPCTVNLHRRSWSVKQCSIIKSRVFAVCHSKVGGARVWAEPPRGGRGVWACGRGHGPGALPAVSPLSSVLCVRTHDQRSSLNFERRGWIPRLSHTFQGTARPDSRLLPAVGGGCGGHRCGTPLAGPWGVVPGHLSLSQPRGPALLGAQGRAWPRQGSVDPGTWRPLPRWTPCPSTKPASKTPAPATPAGTVSASAPPWPLTPRSAPRRAPACSGGPPTCAVSAGLPWSLGTRGAGLELLSGEGRVRGPLPASALPKSDGTSTPSHILRLLQPPRRV